MAKGTTTDWLAVALHYGEPWEEFLIKAVKPYTDVVLHTGVADCFYFERSWDKGPHVLLWFKVSPAIFAKILKPNLEEHFNQYFESRPSFIKAPYYPADYPADSMWLPNNSIQYPGHGPGQFHLGGSQEFSVFEDQYMASSRLVLETIKEKAAGWTYNEMISSAIKVHLGFCYAVGMNGAEAQRFLAFLSEKWFSKNYHVTEERAKVESSFAKIYNLQRKDTVPYHLALWQMFKDYGQMEDEPFADWIKGNSNMGLELDLALHTGKLKPLRTLRPSSFASHPPKWDYFERLFQLTDNRFGIFNKNEGYLLYTMSESLKAVAASVTAHHRMRV